MLSTSSRVNSRCPSSRGERLQGVIRLLWGGRASSPEAALQVVDPGLEERDALLEPGEIALQGFAAGALIDEVRLDAPEVNRPARSPVVPNSARYAFPASTVMCCRTC